MLGPDWPDTDLMEVDASDRRLERRLSRRKRRSSRDCLRISRSRVRLIARREELLISRSRTLRSRRALEASSLVLWGWVDFAASLLIGL